MQRSNYLLSAGAALLVLAAGTAAFFAGRQLGIEQTTQRLGGLPAGPAIIGSGPTAVRDLAAALSPGAASPLPIAPSSPAGGASRLAITMFDARQQAEIGELVRQYLVANPEVLRDAATALDARQAAEEAAAQRLAIQDNRQEIYNSKSQVVIGNPDGDVTLVEFFDYNCTYCRKAAPDIAQLISEDPRLRVVLKEFPILGPGSVEAAKVSIALADLAQDKYRPFHDRLLSDQAPAGADRALAVVDTLGTDSEAIKSAIGEPKVTETINAVYGLATRLGLTGTPTFVIGDQVIVGAVGYEALRSKIQAMRTCGAPDCTAASTR